MFDNFGTEDARRRREEVERYQASADFAAGRAKAPQGPPPEYGLQHMVMHGTPGQVIDFRHDLRLLLHLEPAAGRLAFFTAQPAPGGGPGLRLVHSVCKPGWAFCQAMVDLDQVYRSACDVRAGWVPGPQPFDAAAAGLAEFLAVADYVRGAA